jgi:hypothetical protein
MSLQAGDTTEARNWYTRLLDADPKDAAVIALISEIDEAAEAAPLEMTEIPGIDTDLGDQQIPTGLEVSSELVFLPSDASNATEEVAPAVTSSADSPAAESSAPSSTDSSAPEASSFSSGAAQPGAEVSPPAASSAAEEAPLGLERHYPVQEASPPEADAPTQASSAGGPRLEEVGVTAGDSAADGLTSVIPEAANPLDWSGPPPGASVEEPAASAAPTPPELESFATAFAAAPPPEPATRTPEPLARTPEPPTRAPEPPPRSEERPSGGASAEPFVNETMAQLYLQQGYKQLALQVYRQLVVSRPQDQGLRNRIAEIEAEDAAAHPGEVGVPRKEASVERPSAPAETGPRQPSIREFFATLGRRRPPSPNSRGRSSGNNQPPPADTRPPLGAAPPGATLDTVFAGATVSAADARAASRLAGAFSGTSGSSRASNPTPPVPTPRVNPRVPQAQESEEDVAKFRAWLDGLTGE